MNLMTDIEAMDWLANISLRNDVLIQTDKGRYRLWVGNVLYRGDSLSDAIDAAAIVHKTV